MMAAFALALLVPVTAGARSVSLAGPVHQEELDGTSLYFWTYVGERSAVQRLDLSTGRRRTMLTVKGPDTFVHTIRAGGGVAAVGIDGEGERPSEPGLLAGSRSRVFVARPGRRARVLARGAVANDGEECGSAVVVRDVTPSGAVLLEAGRSPCPGVEGRPAETRLLSYAKGTRRLLLKRNSPSLLEFMSPGDEPQTDHVGGRLLTWGTGFFRFEDWRTGAAQERRWEDHGQGLLFRASGDRAGNLVLIEGTAVSPRSLRISARLVRPGDPPGGGRVLRQPSREGFEMRFCGSQIIEWRTTRTGVAVFRRSATGGRSRRLAVFPIPLRHSFDVICDGSRAGVVSEPGDFGTAIVSWTRIR